MSELNIFGPVLIRAPLDTPLEQVAAENQCCVKAIELLIEQETSRQKKLREEYTRQLWRITMKRLGRVRNERRYKTDRINQNQVHEALQGHVLRSHSSPPTCRSNHNIVQVHSRTHQRSNRMPIFDFTGLKGTPGSNMDQPEGLFTLKRKWSTSR